MAGREGQIRALRLRAQGLKGRAGGLWRWKWRAMRNGRGDDGNCAVAFFTNNKRESEWGRKIY